MWQHTARLTGMAHHAHVAETCRQIAEERRLAAADAWPDDPHRLRVAC